METFEFLVLATTPTGDNALVVHTLSERFGRRGFLVHPGKKAGMALFLPLNILEAQVVENPKSALWGLRGIHSLDALQGIRGNLYKNSMSLFVSEVLFRTLRDGVYEDGLYAWCVGQILTLNALEADFANFPVCFLLGLAGALGFRPTWADIAPFAQEYALSLKPFLELPLEQALLQPLNGATRNALCEQLLQYLSFHCDQAIPVKSLAVLRELFQ
jgi:DNA repair protein RecO (recombination protein O)